MALIDCKECGRVISDKASACPHCGAPVTAAAPGPASAESEPSAHFVDTAPAAGRPGKAQSFSTGFRVTLLVIAAIFGIGWMASLVNSPPSAPMPTYTATAGIANDSAKVAAFDSMTKGSKPSSKVKKLTDSELERIANDGALSSIPDIMKWRLAAADEIARRQEPERIQAILNLAGAAQCGNVKARVTRFVRSDPLWENDVIVNVACRRLVVGLTDYQVKAMFGNPERINSSTYAGGEREQWVYGQSAMYLYFETDPAHTFQKILTSWQESR